MEDPHAAIEHSLGRPALARSHPLLAAVRASERVPLVVAGPASRRARVACSPGWTGTSSCMRRPGFAPRCGGAWHRAGRL